MKKNILLFLFFLLAFAGKTLAQRPGSQIDPEKLQAARVAFITTRIDLKPEQAEKFWPIFNNFTDSREASMRELGALSRNITDLSEEEAKARIQQRFQVEEKMMRDEKAFVAEISKILSSKQILMLNNVARDFTRHLYQRQRGEN